MDGSRENDLYLLKARMEDDTLPYSKRAGARRIFENVRLQIRDRKLTELRRRLILATRFNDLDEAEKLQAQIKEHSYRKGYNKYEDISDK